jgi:hypothetical protein
MGERITNIPRVFPSFDSCLFFSLSSLGTLWQTATAAAAAARPSSSTSSLYPNFSHTFVRGEASTAHLGAAEKARVLERGPDLARDEGDLRRHWQLQKVVREQALAAVINDELPAAMLQPQVVQVLVLDGGDDIHDDGDSGGSGSGGDGDGNGGSLPTSSTAA